MFPKILALLLALLTLPVLASGQNTTLPLEDPRDSKILDIQNQIYELQKLSDALKEQGATLAITLEELQDTSSAHSQDILKALDAITALNTANLETGENVGQEISALKKVQAEITRNHETILAELANQKKKLQGAVETIDRKGKDIAQLAQGNDVLAKSVAGLQERLANQDQLIVNLQKKISLFEGSLTGQQQTLDEIKDIISSQKAKTLGHLSSLENINATLSGLKEQSRTELENIHQSLTQVVTYGLLTIVSVTLFLIIILIFIRRKPARHTTEEQTQDTSQPSPVREEDDEILDWLKEKNQE
jgi:chromosome segregation ATPase